MRVENFLSFGEADFDFDRAGLVLVEGDNRDDDSARSNGSGKSAMIDALVWCLFGTTLRGYDKDEVVNRRVGAGCLVRVALDDGGRRWEVVRGRRHPKQKNALTLLELEAGGGAGAVDKSGASSQETQERVCGLLGCSASSFLSSVVFGQDRAYRFGSLTDAEQKRILDEVLGVERFAEACAAARDRERALSAEAEAARRDMDRAGDLANEAEADAVDLEAKNVDFAETQRRKGAELRARLQETKDELGKTRKFPNREALKATADAALAALAAAEGRYDELVTAHANAVAHKDSSARLEAQARAGIAQAKKASGPCPTCLQDVPGKARARLVAQAGDLHDRCARQLRAAEARRAKAGAALAKAKEEIREARRAVAAAQEATNGAASLEAGLAALKRRRDELEARIAELEAEESPYGALAAKARARCARLREECGQAGARLNEAELRRAAAKFWVDAFGARGLRSLLIDSSLPLLNEEAARVSAAVTGGAIAIEFSATSEQKSGKVVDRFEVRVDNRHGAGDYRGNSAGERAKIDLCVGLALQRLVASRSAAAFNLCFFDEAFDHLDAEAHERVVEVLSAIRKDSVFVISHNEDLRAFFPATLTIRKRGGLSTVVSS